MSPRIEACHRPNKMDLKNYHNIYSFYKIARFINFPHNQVSTLHVSNLMLFVSYNYMLHFAFYYINPL